MDFALVRDKGALYCLDTDLSVHKKVAPASIPNGIVWTSDSQTMYFIDTGLNNVRAYDYDLENGAISNERVVVENEGSGAFDGMAIDEEDNLWIAVYAGSCVRCYDPRGGNALRELQLPMTNLTSCAFGGEPHTLAPR